MTLNEYSEQLRVLETIHKRLRGVMPKADRLVLETIISEKQRKLDSLKTGGSVEDVSYYGHPDDAG